MRKLLLVMLAELRSTLRRKTFLFFAFGVPLALTAVSLVVILVNRGGAEETAVAPTPPEEAETVMLQGYVDPAGLIRTTPADLPPDTLQAYPDEAAAAAALAAGEIAGYYVIAPDYVQTGDLRYTTTGYNPIEEGLDVNPMAWLLMVNLLQDEALAAQVWEPMRVSVTHLQAPGAVPTEETWVTELMPTLMVLILYMIVLTPAGLLVNAITDEKKNRVLEVLITSVSTVQLFSGKFIALLLMGLLQTLTWLGLMWLVLSFGGQAMSVPAGFSVPAGLFVWVLVYGLLGYAMYGVPLAGLGVMAPDMKEVRGATMIIMSPLIVGYLAALVLLESPNSPLALSLSFFPLTSPVVMVARMVSTAVPTWQALLAALLQLLTALLILWLGSRLFKASYLIARQPFSMRRYADALLGRA